MRQIAWDDEKRFRINPGEETFEIELCEEADLWDSMRSRGEDVDFSDYLFEEWRESQCER